jgi:hypothetical protein
LKIRFLVVARLVAHDFLTIPSLPVPYPRPWRP